MPSVVLITGAATGIGNLTATALATAGHTVYASSANPMGTTPVSPGNCSTTPSATAWTCGSIDLDVQSQDSCNAAVKTIVDDSGQLDAVINNAGHLYVGYTEAYTAEGITRTPHRRTTNLASGIRAPRSTASGL